MRGSKTSCGQRYRGKSDKSLRASRQRSASIGLVAAWRRSTCATSTSSRWGAWSVSSAPNNRASTAFAAGVRNSTSRSAEASPTIPEHRAPLGSPVPARHGGSPRNGAPGARAAPQPSAAQQLRAPAPPGPRGASGPSAAITPNSPGSAPFANNRVTCPILRYGRATALP